MSLLASDVATSRGPSIWAVGSERQVATHVAADEHDLVACYSGRLIVQPALQLVLSHMISIWSLISWSLRMHSRTNRKR